MAELVWTNMTANELRRLLDWLDGKARDEKLYAQSHPDKWEREAAHRAWEETDKERDKIRQMLAPKLVVFNPHIGDNAPTQSTKESTWQESSPRSQ
jgi:hypothetical protein